MKSILQSNLWSGNFRCLAGAESKFPKLYKADAINDNQNRSYQISMSFDLEKEAIREKCCLAGFPTRFVDNVIHQFHQKLTLS